MDDKTRDRLKKAIRYIKKRQGNILVKSFEQFDTASYVDVRKSIYDYIKIYGYAPDLIVIDYTELLDTGDGKRYSTNFEGENT